MYERRSLFRMQEARLGVTEMAARLGRHRLTIYRELGRNRFCDRGNARHRRRDMPGYHPVAALTQAVAGQRQFANLARHGDLLADVLDRLRAGR